MDVQEHARIVARLAHDLRGPLSGILGLVQTLRRRSVPPETLAEFLARAESSCKRMDVLIADFLTLAEIDAGRLEVRVEAAEPGAVAEEAAALATGTVDLTLPSEPLPTLQSDPLRLTQILLRLLDNAERYSATPPRLVVTAGEGTVRFAVSDDGPGIPPGEAARVFERYYQVPDDRHRGRSGLGLAVARELADALGARLHLAQAEGAGARFILEVPAR